MELKREIFPPELLKKLNVLSFTLVPIALLIGDKTTFISLLLFIVTTCFRYKLNELFQQIKIIIKNKWTILFSLIYVIQLLRFPYFDGSMGNFFTANDTQVPLLIMPIIVQLFYHKSSSININVTLEIFSYSAVFLGFIYLGYSFYTLGFYDLESVMKTLPNMHIYYGVFLCLSGAYFMFRIIEQGISFKRVLMIFIILLLLVLIGSRTATFIFFFFFISTALVITKKWSRKATFLVILSILLVLIVFFTTFTPRFLELFNDKGHNPLYIRSILWDCSFRTFKENFLFGVGTRDLAPYLYECYEEYRFSGKTLNPHNEYLRNGAKYGIIGLLLLLSMFIAPFFYSIKKKNTIFLFFIFMIICISFFECIFARQVGIVFYSYFNSVLFFKNKIYCR